MTIVEWITLSGVAVATLSIVGAVVYSYTMLKQDVKNMHKCQRITMRLVVRYGRALRKHTINAEERFVHIENKLGVSTDEH